MGDAELRRQIDILLQQQNTIPDVIPGVNDDPHDIELFYSLHALVTEMTSAALTLVNGEYIFIHKLW